MLANKVKNNSILYKKTHLKQSDSERLKKKKWVNYFKKNNKQTRLRF